MAAQVALRDTVEATAAAKESQNKTRKAAREDRIGLRSASY